MHSFARWSGQQLIKWQSQIRMQSICSFINCYHRCCLHQHYALCTVLTLYKKSELMLMRRATASVLFRTHIVLYISAKIHSKCASQPKIAKKSLKTPIFGVQGRSRLSMLVPPESSSAVVVMISSKSVSIGNHSRARLVEVAEIARFQGGAHI